MQITATAQGTTLYISLNGEMDEHTAKNARQVADATIDKNLHVSRAVFNLQKVAFMDSTGIGFLIGRYKKLKKLGIGAYISEPNESTDKILTLCGIYALIPKICV